MTRHYEIPSLFHILTSFVHMAYQFAHRQAVSRAVNGSRRFRDCLTPPVYVWPCRSCKICINNLDKRTTKHPAWVQRSFGNDLNRVKRQDYKTLYYREILDRNDELEMHFYCWWVLSDCAIRETSDQRGKCHEITFLIFTFHLNQRHIGARIIPCRCISIKNDFQWGPCWPIYRQPKPSPDCGRKIQNESNNVHIATYSCKPELISWR